MVVTTQMIGIIDINAICDELGTNPPKVVEYANCSAIIIRNGDGVKVLIVAEEGMSRESVKHRIAAAFKVKAENLASDGKLAAVFAEPLSDEDAARVNDAVEAKIAEAKAKPDPVTPAKDIRAHQESKKLHNK